ncbi:MAG: DUF3604 domain-containing protein [Bryobacterales bacterium]
MLRRILASALLLALFALAFRLSRPTESAAQEPPLRTVGKIESISLMQYGQSFNHGFPDIIRSKAGDDWVAYVSARPKETPGPHKYDDYTEGDFIVVRRRHGGEWGDELVLNDDFGVNFDPKLAEDSAGNVFVVFVSRRNNEFALYSRRVGPDLSLGSETKILTAGRLEMEPDLIADETGRLWLIAQSYRRGSMDIVFYTLEGSGWRQMPDVSSTPAPEFRPNLALAPDGALWAAWDAYEDGKYRVKAARYDRQANRWGAALDVPGDGKLDAYAPDLGVDSAGRVWVAYARNEVLEAKWGRRGPAKGGPPRPTTRVVVRDSDGKWKYPAGGDDPGFVHKGDLPRLAVGPDDSVWVGFQFFAGHVDWKVGMAALTAEGWKPFVFGMDEPVAIDGPPKRADQLPSFYIPEPGRAVIAYQRGRGTFRNRDIYLREVASPPQGLPRLAAFAGSDLTPQPRLAMRQAERQPVFDGQAGRYQLYFGDLHNHLLVDDGHEGSVDQLFNFHRDRFGSDFGATTSHGDSNKLLYSELAINDALTEAIYQPGRFVAIPGFEWTQGDYVVPRAGHRHAIYETPGGKLWRPTEGISDSIREFSDLMSKTNGMIFAHHITRPLTGGTDWSYVNIKVEPAAEMCSSWGRFEYYRNPGHINGDEIKGCSMQDVWKMGWRLGVIGGSDGHDLYGARIQGLTGVYAAELTRPAIFDAIRKRRIYATTGDPIELEFKVDGHLMGSEVEASSGPLIEAKVKGVRRLLAVEVIKYQQGTPYPFPTAYRAELDGSAEAKLHWRDPDFDRDALYYLRVTQEADPAVVARYADSKPNPFPTEMAWSSPVWVDKK